jgi:hypothetical protein
MMLTIVKMMLVMMMMIHFRGTSANISIAEIGNVARNAFRVPRRFREPWFSDPFRESLRGASALQVFTSARSSYFKPKIKRIHQRRRSNDIAADYDHQIHRDHDMDVKTWWKKTVA